MYYNYPMSTRTRILLLAAVLSVRTGAAAADKPKAPSAPAPQGFCIFGGQSGRSFGTLAAFKAAVWKSDVVYVGGLNSSADDQRARAAVLRTMREARGARIAVGFDFLDTKTQPALDDYAAGRISSEEFLERTEWRKRRAADFELYKPVFDLISQNRLKALALGLPAEVSEIIENGGLSALPGPDRAALPEKLPISRNAGYLERLKSSFSPSGPDASAAWDNHLSAVSAWNESAGSRIAEFIGSNPGWAALVLAENERLLYNAALPASVKSRTSRLTQSSFYLDSAVKCPPALPKTHRDLANYIWYVVPSTGPAAGL